MQPQPDFRGFTLQGSPANLHQLFGPKDIPLCPAQPHKACHFDFHFSITGEGPPSRDSSLHQNQRRAGGIKKKKSYFMCWEACIQAPALLLLLCVTLHLPVSWFVLLHYERKHQDGWLSSSKHALGSLPLWEPATRLKSVRGNRGPTQHPKLMALGPRPRQREEEADDFQPLWSPVIIPSWGTWKFSCVPITKQFLTKMSSHIAH